jgi:hypothetical protein
VSEFAIFFGLICLQNAAFFSFSFFVVCQDHVRAEGKFSLVGGLGVRGVTQTRALIASFHWFVLEFCEIRGELIIVDLFQ